MFTDCEDQVQKCRNFRSFSLTASCREYEFIKVENRLKGCCHHWTQKVIVLWLQLSSLVMGMLLLLLWAAPSKIPQLQDKLVQQWFDLLIPFMFLLMMLLDQCRGIWLHPNRFFIDLKYYYSPTQSEGVLCISVWKA